ncbi:hypothetical protein K490DRAFT_68235 [Saccharata proteae CBS 121410]|uniref:Uncharacterized protein n=1 Tax=Saccharata proteae CBS 121410 TaxID=1314787 RepID=A0A9P4LSZ4_9PEZI|nr:hypothetical protein K490DRAFT_68235 [Saccharata proteae CBS 121410]
MSEVKQSLIILWYQGKHFLSHYCWYDDHPSPQGPIILRFIRDPANITKLKAALDKKVALGEMVAFDKPTILGLGADSEHTTLDLRSMDDRGSTDYKAKHEADIEKRGLDGPAFVKAFSQRPPYQPKWPGVYRHTGAKILDLMANATRYLIMVDDLDTPDSQDADWSYVIDPDAHTLEVYSDRYPPDSIRLPLGGDRSEECMPLVARWLFDQLPDEGIFELDWLEELRESEYEDGDEDEEVANEDKDEKEKKKEKKKEDYGSLPELTTEAVTGPRRKRRRYLRIKPTQ